MPPASGSLASASVLHCCSRVCVWLPLTHTIYPITVCYRAQPQGQQDAAAAAAAAAAPWQLKLLDFGASKRAQRLESDFGRLTKDERGTLLW